MPELVSHIASNAAPNSMNKFERWIIGKRAVRVAKRFTLLIATEVMNDVVKIKTLPEYLGVLKHEIKKQERRFLGAVLTLWWLHWCNQWFLQW